MDSGSQKDRVKIAIFGAGKVGTAMSAEMPNVPIVSRKDDIKCDVACVCWPAHALREFNKTHPLAASAIKVAFCNGVWAEQEGMDKAGICYIRVTNIGDKAKVGYKGWRVGDKTIGYVLREQGLGVIISTDNHKGFLWAKVLYLFPLALACAEKGLTARDVIDTSNYESWYKIVRNKAVKDISSNLVAIHERRIDFLINRSPKGWIPSPSSEELKYFKRRLLED